MSLITTYSKIISPFIEKYQDAANEKGRKVVIGEAVNAVKNSKIVLEDGEKLPKNLPTAIRRFIRKSIAKEDAPEDEKPAGKPKKVKKKYTSRDVIKYNYVDRIAEENPFISTDKGYLGGYQKAVSKVLRDMTEEELEEVENLVDLWNKEGAPSEVQQKRARTKLPKEIRAKLEDWKFRTGALMLCLVAYQDGKDVRTMQIETTPCAGNAFTSSYPDWKAGTYESFEQWALKQFGEKEADSDDEVEIPIHHRKAKDLEFEKNPRGDLVLPPLSNYKTVRQKQRVVRGYIGATGEFTGNKRAAFPFILASKDGQTIFSTDSVPNNFVLADPDHLNVDVIDKLYKHWLRRQQKKLTPFVILKAGPQHHASEKPSAKAMGKRKMEYEDVNTEDEEVASEGDNKVDDEGLDNQQVPISPFVKIGPPIGKAKQTLHSTQHDESFEPVAESSKHASKPALQQKYAKPRGLLPKKTLTFAPSASASDPPSPIERPNTRNFTNLKKRKAEEDLKEDQVRKSRKRTGNVPVQEPVNVEKGRKRKAADEGQPTPKRKRANEREATPKRSSGVRKVSPPPPPPPDVEGGRIKEFPAGNLATSSSRKAFLYSLCKLPKFRSMVDLIQSMPKPSAIPRSFPKWASWSSREVFLPPSFHSHNSFQKYLAIVKDLLRDGSVFKDGRLDAALLLLGLLFREVSRAMEMEPGEDNGFPGQLVGSPFGIDEVEEIERLVGEVVLPSL